MENECCNGEQCKGPVLDLWPLLYVVNGRLQYSQASYAPLHTLACKSLTRAMSAAKQWFYANMLSSYPIPVRCMRPDD